MCVVFLMIKSGNFDSERETHRSKIQTNTNLWDILDGTSRKHRESNVQLLLQFTASNKLKHAVSCTCQVRKCWDWIGEISINETNDIYALTIVDRALSHEMCKCYANNIFIVSLSMSATVLFARDDLITNRISVSLFKETIQVSVRSILYFNELSVPIGNLTATISKQDRRNAPRCCWIQKWLFWICTSAALKPRFKCQVLHPTHE